MDTSALESLRERHDYDAWRGANRLSEDLFVWRFFLAGQELPGWQAHRIQLLEAEGWPRSVHSIWKRPGAGDTAASARELLGLDVYECDSRAAAHDALLRALGELQSTNVVRDRQDVVGDVSFRVPGDAAVLFARANVVVLVRSAGVEIVAAPEPARQLDADLARKSPASPAPAGGPASVVPQIRRFESASRTARVGAPVSLDVEVDDPLGRPVWFKLFARGGEVWLADGRLSYQAAEAGTREIELFAVNANGGVARTVLELTAE
jgi:hypothetical protein